jgi:hypothetical protein
LFLLVDGDGVVLQVNQDLQLTISGILIITFHNRLFEEPIEAKNVSIQSHPIRLELFAGLDCVFGVEVVM